MSSVGVWTSGITNMFKKFFVFFLAGLFGGTASYAQETDSNEVDDALIVYGVRLEQAATEIGSSVSVLTADDIDALGTNFLLDAIATIPGVTINQNGSFGGPASVRIRGASSEQTLVIIDGVVANDPTSPGGGFDFARIDPANIERIEVLKGPQSTLWGTDAIGGVVNIVTKRPEEGMNGKVFAQAGSFNSFRGGAEFQGASERFDFRLAATDTSTDGISKADENNGNTENDGYDATTVSAQAGMRLAGDARLQANLLWTDAESEFDSFSFGDQGNVADGDEVSKTEELVANISLHLPLFGGKLENVVLAGYSDIDRNNFSDGSSSFSSKGDRKTYRYQGTLRVNVSNRIAFGAEREYSESNGDDIAINGLFALYELQALDSLTVTAGIRRDDHDRFDAETTGRIAIAYNPTDQLTLRASWGEGFKAPTLFQTTFFCCGAIGPNPNLQPETSEAYDVGVTFRTPDARGELGLTYFDQDSTNLIVFSFAVGAYENLSSATSSGIELDARYRLTDWLEAGIAYAYIDAKDGSGMPLIRVPERSGDLLLSFNPDGRISGTIQVKYNGEEHDPNGSVDSWTRVDLAGRYALSESVELYARIENLFDAQYQQILGYGTPGLSGHLGARLSF
jgi:vitamin B12 transporter